MSAYVCVCVWEEVFDPVIPVIVSISEAKKERRGDLSEAIASRNFREDVLPALRLRPGKRLWVCLCENEKQRKFTQNRTKY